MADPGNALLRGTSAAVTIADAMNSIVISIGGLHVSYLGCYGNGWIETPAFDRLAAEGFTFDQCFADTPILALARRSWLSARYQCFHSADAPDLRLPASKSLIELLSAGGIRTILIRDTHELLGQHAEAPAGFDSVIELARGEQSSLEHLFDAARQWLESNAAAGQFLVFIDCHGAHPPWPPTVQRSEAGDSVELPEEIGGFDEDTDPATRATFDDNGGDQDSEDISAAAQQTYAEVITTLDEHVGNFLEFLRGTAAWQESLVIVTSDVSAMPGGEQKEPAEDFSIGEATQHVPLLVRFPETQEAASRSGSLVQSIDLLPTVCDALGVAVPSEVDGRSLLPVLRLQTKNVRDHVLMGVPSRSMSIRTPMWHLTLGASEAESPSQLRLFTKPDDRWERNDVAQQYPDVVEQLEQRLRARTKAR